MRNWGYTVLSPVSTKYKPTGLSLHSLEPRLAMRNQWEKMQEWMTQIGEKQNVLELGCTLYFY